MENPNGPIGNRTRDLPPCIAVPQPTALPRTPSLLRICRFIHMKFLVGEVVGQGFLRILRFSPVSIIPPMVHTLSVFYRRRYITLATGSIVK